jgi:hypothetical protein
MELTWGRQNGHWSVLSASGGGWGSDSVPGSFSSIRLNEMRQVRPVMGLVRISIFRSAITPEGSINLAETD